VSSNRCIVVNAVLLAVGSLLITRAAELPGVLE